MLAFSFLFSCNNIKNENEISTIEYGYVFEGSKLQKDPVLFAFKCNKIQQKDNVNITLSCGYNYPFLQSFKNGGENYEYSDDIGAFGFYIQYLNSESTILETEFIKVDSFLTEDHFYIYDWAEDLSLITVNFGVNIGLFKDLSSLPSFGYIYVIFAFKLLNGEIVNNNIEGLQALSPIILSYKVNGEDAILELC